MRKGRTANTAYVCPNPGEAPGKWPPPINVLIKTGPHLGLAAVVDPGPKFPSPGEAPGKWPPLINVLIKTHISSGAAAGAGHAHFPRG